MATALVADFLIFRRRCVGAPVPWCLEPNHSSEKKMNEKNKKTDILKPKKDITAAFHKYLAVILGERTEAAEDAMFTRKVGKPFQTARERTRSRRGNDR